MAAAEERAASHFAPPSVSSFLPSHLLLQQQQQQPPLPSQPSSPLPPPPPPPLSSAGGSCVASDGATPASPVTRAAARASAEVASQYTTYCVPRQRVSHMLPANFSETHVRVYCTCPRDEAKRKAIERAAARFFKETSIGGARKRRRASTLF